MAVLLPDKLIEYKIPQMQGQDIDGVAGGIRSCGWLKDVMAGQGMYPKILLTIFS